MKDLTVMTRNNVEVVESREVARMIGKDHKNLMRSIREYAECISNELNFELVDFFIPSTYKDSKGETRLCYLLTKKGCDMVANKTTGEKGVLFTAAYVTAFEKMREKALEARKLPADKATLAEAQLNNSRVRLAAAWMKLAGLDPSPEFRRICAREAGNALAGHKVE